MSARIRVLEKTNICRDITNRTSEPGATRSIIEKGSPYEILVSLGSGFALHPVISWPFFTIWMEASMPFIPATSLKVQLSPRTL